MATVTRTFDELFLHELAILASAEQQMAHALPALAVATDTPELKHALETQADGCARQHTVLLGLLRADTSHTEHDPGSGMKALLAECNVLLRQFPTGNLRDAVMIAHMQRAEHYKMAAYASVRDYAHLLGNKDAERLLAESLKGVTAASRTLSQIAIQIDAEAYVDTRIEHGAA